MTSLRVALACQEAAGLQTLRRVVDRGHRVVAVFTDPTREPSGAPGVAGAAGELGLDVRDARLVRDPGLGGWLRDERVDVLLNVHSLYLVAEAVVEAPSIGSFNLHPGPLPTTSGARCVARQFPFRETYRYLAAAYVHGGESMRHAKSSSG